MAELQHGPAELGAEMDYKEHDSTYKGFTWLVKWGTIVLCALMASMAFAFFAAGWFSGVILFALIMAAAVFLA